jgi:peptidoglycan/xylan/chitin deacetylase (PgdA/CDA1 family)
VICFRFDIDTRRGLVERVPPLLDLLDEVGIRATFFCVMGREANLWEIVRLRLLADRDRKSPLNVDAKGGKLSVLKAALFPGGVGASHPEILLDIVGRGHELGPHGWSHIQWQRNLEAIDVDRHLRRAMEAYEAVIGRPPAGFASPGRTCDERALRAFDAVGLRYAGDLDGRVPFRPDGHRHLQLPITRFETVAQMRRRGLTDDDIVRAYLDDIEREPEYCCLYEHPDDLDGPALAIFQRVFVEVRARGLEPVTLSEAVDAWEPRLAGSGS